MKSIIKVTRKCGKHEESREIGKRRGTKRRAGAYLPNHHRSPTVCFSRIQNKIIAAARLKVNHVENPQISFWLGEISTA